MAKSKKHKHMTISNWKGHQNFECNYCKFATLNRREMRMHTDVHIRAGIAEAEEEANIKGMDENYGLDVEVSGKVGAQTKGKKKDGK